MDEFQEETLNLFYEYQNLNLNSNFSIFFNKRQSSTLVILFSNQLTTTADGRTGQKRVESSSLGAINYYLRH